MYSHMCTLLYKQQEENWGVGGVGATVCHFSKVFTATKSCWQASRPNRNFVKCGYHVHGPPGTVLLALSHNLATKQSAKQHASPTQPIKQDRIDVYDKVKAETTRYSALLVFF